MTRIEPNRKFHSRKHYPRLFQLVNFRETSEKTGRVSRIGDMRRLNTAIRSTFCRRLMNTDELIRECRGL